MAGETGKTTDRTLNKLQYAIANKADTITADAADLLLISDASDDFKVGKVLFSALGAAGVAQGTQVANITDASVAHALNSTFSDTEVEAALNALGTKINSIIAALEEFGISAAV